MELVNERSANEGIKRGGKGRVDGREREREGGMERGRKRKEEEGIEGVKERQREVGTDESRVERKKEES